MNGEDRLLGGCVLVVVHNIVNTGSDLLYVLTADQGSKQQTPPLSQVSTVQLVDDILQIK